MKLAYETLEDEPFSSILGHFNVERTEISYRTYGFGASSVSSSKLAVTSAGLSGYCKMKRNRQ